MTGEQWIYNGVEFKVGDSVTVTGFEATGAEDGMGDGIKWENSWVDEVMDAAIGKQFEISNIDETGVEFIDFVENGYDAAEYAIMRYPLSVLAKVQ